MTEFQYKAPAAVLAVLLSTTAVSAQVTGEQVWANWQAQMAMGDASVEIGSESLDAGVLTLTDIAIDSEDAEGGTMSMSIAAMTLTDQADGTVAITMSDMIPVDISFVDPEGGDGAISFEITQTGMRLVASGTPLAVTYDVAATRYAVAITEITGSEGVVEADVLFGMNDMAGTYGTSLGDDGAGLTYAISAASLDVLANITDPAEGGNTFNLTGKSAAFEMTADGAVPMMAIGSSDPAAIFSEGLDLTGSYSIGASSYAFSLVEMGQTTEGTASMAEAYADVSMDETNVDIDTGVTGLAITANGPTMPFPITVSLAEYGLGFAMPLSATDEPAPFRAEINLTELSLNDEIWAMFDPASVLPRDAATVVLSLSGTARMLLDIYDPAQQEAAMAAGTPPGELHTLNLDEFLIEFGGADISATGAFTFDNDKPSMVPGLAQPTGAIDIAINGANALMGKLVQMGLVPEDQVMMAQMMMGMFAVPAGDDMLTSKIEFMADGGIFANGQQIQ